MFILFSQSSLLSLLKLIEKARYIGMYELTRQKRMDKHYSLDIYLPVSMFQITQ